MKNSERAQARSLLKKLCDEKIRDEHDPCQPDDCENCHVHNCMKMLADKPAHSHN